MAVRGSDDATIRGDADEAHIEFTDADTTSTRQLRRQHGSIVTDVNRGEDDDVSNS